MRSCYQPITSLAQLHDCHSCYNERSIVQKKRNAITYHTSFAILCAKFFLKGQRVSNTIAIASGGHKCEPHRGARGRACLLNTLAFTCSGALPPWCTIEVAALLAFTEETAIMSLKCYLLSHGYAQIFLRGQRVAND